MRGIDERPAQFFSYVDIERRIPLDHPLCPIRHKVRITAYDGAYIEYLPDPQILFLRSSLESTLTVTLAGSGCAIVADSFLTHDPAAAGGLFTSYRSEIAIEDENGKRLAVDRIHLNARLLAVNKVGIAGHFAAQGTMIVAGSSCSSRKSRPD